MKKINIDKQGVGYFIQKYIPTDMLQRIISRIYLSFIHYIPFIKTYDSYLLNQELKKIDWFVYNYDNNSLIKQSQQISDYDCTVLIENILKNINNISQAITDISNNISEFFILKYKINTTEFIKLMTKKYNNKQITILALKSKLTVFAERKQITDNTSSYYFVVIYFDNYIDLIKLNNLTRTTDDYYPGISRDIYEQCIIARCGDDKFNVNLIGCEFKCLL
jgi:hypothetical protein